MWHLVLTLHTYFVTPNQICVDLSEKMNVRILSNLHVILKLTLSSVSIGLVMVGEAKDRQRYVAPWSAGVK